VSEIKPFDETRNCPKCDFSADAKHRRDNGMSGGYNRITRTCRRCHYAWDEAPLDYDEAAEATAIEDASRRFLVSLGITDALMLRRTSKKSE
jgi:hypothetical protein